MSVKSNVSSALQKGDTSVNRSQDRSPGTFRGKISPKELSGGSNSQERTSGSSPGKTLSPQELSGLKNAHYPYHSFTLPKHCCVNCEFDSRPVTRRNPCDMPEEIKSPTRPLVANTKPENPCEVISSTKTFAHSADNYQGPVPQILLNEQVIVGIPSSNKIQGNEKDEPTSEQVEVMTEEGIAVEIVVQQGVQGHTCSETCDYKCSGTNVLPQIPSDDHAMQVNIKSPSSEKSCITSAAEHEYLQFALRITEDIIKNDLYSNAEIKRVFNSHIEANRGRLNEERMKDQLKKLALELNLSYSDILLSNADYDSDHMPSSDQQECDCCACYDLEVIDCLCGSEQYLPKQFDEVTCACDGDSTRKPIKNHGGTKHSRQRRNSRHHSRKSTERRANLKGEKKPVPKTGVKAPLKPEEKAPLKPQEKALLKAEEKAFLSAEKKAFRKAEEGTHTKFEDKDNEDHVMTMHMKSHALQKKISSFYMENGCPKRRYDWNDSSEKNRHTQQEKHLRNEQLVSTTIYHEKSVDTRSKVQVKIHSSMPTDNNCSDFEKSVQSDDWKAQERKSLRSNTSQQDENVSTLSECTCAESNNSGTNTDSKRKTKDEPLDNTSKVETTDKSTKTDVCPDDCEESSKKKKSGHRRNSSKSKSGAAKSKSRTKRRASSGPSKMETKGEKLSTPNDNPTKRTSAKNLTERVRTGTPKGRKPSSKGKTRAKKSDSTKPNPTKKETTDISIQSEKDIGVGATSPIPVEAGIQSEPTAKTSKTFVRLEKESLDTVELKCRKKCGSKDSVKSVKGKVKTKHHKEKLHKRSESPRIDECSQIGKDTCSEDTARSREKCVCGSNKDELMNLDELAVTKLSLRSHSREMVDRRSCIDQIRPGCLTTPNINVDILVQTEDRAPELKNFLLQPLVRHVSQPYTPLVQSNLVGSNYVQEPDQNLLANENETNSGETEGYLMMPAPIYISPQGIGLVSPTMAYYPPGLKTIQVTPATESNLIQKDNNNSSKSASKRSRDTQTKLSNKGCCICPSATSTKCTLKTCHAIGNKSRDDLLLSDYYDNEMPPNVSQFFPTIATQTSSSDFLMIEKIISLSAAMVKQKKSEVSLQPSKDPMPSSFENTETKQPSIPKVVQPEYLMSERQHEEQRMKINTIIPILPEGEEEEEEEEQEQKQEKEEQGDIHRAALRLKLKKNQSPHSTVHSQQMLLEVGEMSETTLDGDLYIKDNEETVVGTTSPYNQEGSEEDLNITVEESDISNMHKKPVNPESSNIENEVMVGGSDDDFMKKLDHKPDMSMTTSMEHRIKKVVHESEVFRHPKEKGAEWANVNLKLLEGDEQTLSEEDEDESQTIMPTQSLQSKYILTEPQKSKKLENTTIGENDDDSVSSKAKL